MLKELGGGSGRAGGGKTQTRAEALEGAAGPTYWEGTPTNGARGHCLAYSRQQNPEDTWLSKATKGTRVGPGFAQGSSHLFQQACIKSIVLKVGPERLRIHLRSHSQASESPDRDFRSA